MSHYQALHGTVPPLLGEFLIPFALSEGMHDKAQAKAAIVESIKARMKYFAVQKHSEQTLDIGDMVYLKIQHYSHNALGIHNSLKLHSKYYGPFRVLEKIGSVAYRLLLPTNCHIHHVFHVSQLKKHLGSKAFPESSLPLVDPDGNILSASLAVLERRLIPRNNESVVQWKIHWTNLPELAAT